MTPPVSILISTFNEEDNIEACVRAVRTALPDAEIVVIDGGTDATLERARAMATTDSRIVAVRNENDRGKGHAIRTGVTRASAPIMAQFDCDLQFFAEDLPALLAPVRRGDADLVLGSRFLASSDRTAYRPSFFRDVGNRLLSAFISLLIGRRVTDVTAGMKAWTRDAIRRIDFRDERYSYEAEIVVRAARLGLRIIEVPVRYASRTAGGSMHRNNWAVIMAGLVIMAKSFAARWRGM